MSELIDGRNTVAQIIEELGSRLDSREVTEALESFKSQGLLNLDRSSRPRPAEVFWSSFELDDGRTGPLEGKPVELLATNRDDAQMLAQQVHAAGLLTRAQGELRIVIATDYADHRLEKLNREALASGCPWMLVRPTGREVWIGPIFVPGKTACWRCLAHRLEENFWLRDCLSSEVRSEILQPCRGDLEVARKAALGLASVEAAKWFLMKSESALCGRLWSLDLRSLESRYHYVARRCRFCSCAPRGGELKPFQVAPALVDSGTTYAGQTGHRCCPPRETLQRLQRYVSPITGIIGGSEDCVGGGAEGIYVCRGSYATATLALSSSSRLGGRLGIAVGKGFTPQDAQASMMAEAVERYCASFQGQELTLLGRYGELSDRMIHPAELLQYSPKQYENRRQWNAGLPAIHQISDPFDESVPVDWVAAESLTDGKQYLLPAAYCYSRYPLPSGHEFCLADSNGCAAGNRLQEAVVQGFLELVERDAAALWWYNRIPRRQVSLQSFDHQLAGMDRRFSFADRSLHILDLTSDLGIPVFAAVSANEKGRDVLVGLGAHFDGRVALHRAVAELGQVLAFWPPRHNTFEAADPGLDHLLARWRKRSLEEEPFLQPSKQRAAEIGDFHDWPDADPVVEFEACIRTARENRLNLLILDLSRPDIDFVAVRVTVPGLRHFWPRFGPGRLYEVPVRMGWRNRATSEEQLNPFGFFL